MRRIPWRVSLRYNRKGVVTVVGIALSVAFSLSSAAVATALERDTLGLAQNHLPSALIGSAPDGAPVPAALLSSFPGAFGVRLGSGVDAHGVQVVVAALVGPDAPAVAATSARRVGTEPGAGAVLFEGRTLAPGPAASHPAVAERTYLVAPEAFPGPADVFDYILVLEPRVGDERALRDAGLVVVGAPALESFFQTSGVEVGRDLLLVAVFSSILAAIFSYEFLRSEVRENRRAIGVWRAVGMRGRDVVALVLARAGIIGVGSIIVGAGVAVLALRYAHERTGSGALRFALSPAAAIGLPLAFLGAVLLGGLLPALVARRISVQDALESAQ